MLRAQYLLVGLSLAVKLFSLPVDPENNTSSANQPTSQTGSLAQADDGNRAESNPNIPIMVQNWRDRDSGSSRMDSIGSDTVNNYRGSSESISETDSDHTKSLGQVDDGNRVENNPSIPIMVQNWRDRDRGSSRTDSIGSDTANNYRESSESISETDSDHMKSLGQGFSFDKTAEAQGMVASILGFSSVRGSEPGSQRIPELEADLFYNSDEEAPPFVHNIYSRVNRYPLAPGVLRLMDQANRVPLLPDAASQIGRSIMRARSILKQAYPNHNVNEFLSNMITGAANELSDGIFAPIPSTAQDSFDILNPENDTKEQIIFGTLADGIITARSAWMHEIPHFYVDEVIAYSLKGVSNLLLVYEDVSVEMIIEVLLEHWGSVGFSKKNSNINFNTPEYSAEIQNPMFSNDNPGPSNINTHTTSRQNDSRNVDSDSLASQFFTGIGDAINTLTHPFGGGAVSVPYSNNGNTEERDEADSLKADLHIEKHELK